jgi:signal transduction histidine kinase
MVRAMFELSIDRKPGKVEDLGPIDLKHCVDQALNEVGPTVAEKITRVTIDIAEPPAGALRGRDDQIQRLLINLLDNACKFTPKNGEIEIRAYPCFWERRRFASARPAGRERRQRQCRAHNGYRVDVRNSGKPILNQHLETIFEQYVSYSAGQDRPAGGLGLAICRMIANQHYGRIWAENTDRGPVFSLVLPVCNSSRPATSEAAASEVSSYAEVV